jgi:Carboxypeptidase regulatory-like domain
MRGPLAIARKHRLWDWIRGSLLSFSICLTIATVASRPVRGKTASTGALAGVVLDPSGVAIPGAVIHLSKQETSQEKSTTSDEQGRFGFQFLSPGRYELQASKASFEPLRAVTIDITVTEVHRIELHLRLAKLQQSVRVSSDVLMIQTDNSSLEREVSGNTLTNLPLVTRNIY